MNQLQSLGITIVLIIISLNQTMGQCSVDVGNNMTVCVDLGLFELTLGEDLIIDNGTPPYTYAWSCNYSIGSLDFTASDFLNDTTLANPELIDWVDDSLEFHISVTDLNQNTCSDTLLVFFCQYGITLEDKQTTIMQGDTTQLYPGVYGNCDPVEYQWVPDYNISDPNVPNPLVWPGTTTYYVATAIDSAGCEITDETFEVFVNPLNTIELEGNTSIKIFPNPMTDFVVVEISGFSMNNLRIALYDSQGRIVSETNISGNRTKIKKENLHAGLYIYQLFQNNQPMGQGKLIVE